MLLGVLLDDCLGEGLRRPFSRIGFTLCAGSITGEGGDDSLPDKSDSITRLVSLCRCGLSIPLLPPPEEKVAFFGAAVWDERKPECGERGLVEVGLVEVCALALLPAVGRRGAGVAADFVAPFVQKVLIGGGLPRNSRKTSVR